MLVIVGSRHDPAVADLLKRWSAQDAALLSCEDLSTAGWRHRLGDPSASQAVVDGAIVREPDIRGVLVRRPWVMELELTQIAVDDREYVGAEMNAFLTSWLTHLRCPVLNRPQATCLCGPNWRPLQWVRAASQLGIASERMLCSAPAADSGIPSPVSSGSACTEVTVVGERCFGAPSEQHADHARRLAEFAHTPLLGVRFEDRVGVPRFVSATAMPSLKDPAIAAAVCGYLLSEAAA